MHAEWAFDGLRAGARVVARLGPRGTALVGPHPAMVTGVPPGLGEGAALLAEVVREALPEAGRLKPARLRAVPDGGPPRDAPALAERLAAAGHDVRAGLPADVAEGWDEGWAAAALGRLPIEGGLLRFSPTPALLAIDIDGQPDPCAAAQGVARAIRLWGLGGNIVVDFPTRPGRDWRQAAARAFDAAMEGLPHERTAINGFGLLQVVAPRTRPSILERARLMPDEAEAIALLDATARETRPGTLRLVARPPVARLLASRPDLLAAAARAAGRAVDVHADPAAGTGHVEAA